MASNSLFVRDGPFYTCAGGSEALDFSLSLIKEDYGCAVEAGIRHRTSLGSEALIDWRRWHELREGSG
jgi:transcriptional regulator GlxA family with amidase domain